jgi:hypothetical protein
MRGSAVAADARMAAWFALESPSNAHRYEPSTSSRKYAAGNADTSTIVTQ